MTHAVEIQHSDQRRVRKPMFRIPVGFGPSPGPRRGPDGRAFDPATSKRTTSFYVAFSTDGDRLQELLPLGFELTEPVVTVKASVLSDVSWLGGRSYSMLGVYVLADHVGRTRTAGSYCAVLWENLADPILTGREELGMAKLFADIDVTVENEGREASIHATWMGFRFVTLSLSRTGRMDAAPKALPTLHYKYIPRSGAWGTGDAEYATVIPAEDPSVSLEEAWAADGTVSFSRPEWVDMPTQAHIVQALADLPQTAVCGAGMVSTVGGKDYADVSVLDT